MMCWAFEDVSAWASVLATTNSQPSSPLEIMLLTAFPPAPPTPITVIRGFSSRISGTFVLVVIFASSLRGPRRDWAGPPPAVGGLYLVIRSSPAATDRHAPCSRRFR